MKAVRAWLWTAIALASLAAGLSRPAEAQAIIRTSGAPISIDVGKGVLITLPQPADTVFVADQNVADVQVKSPQLIYLFGKAPGTTSLFAVDATQQVLLNRPVAVRRDVAELQSALTQLHPNGSIRVSAVDKSVVLSGKVASPVDAEEVKQLADSYVTDEKDLVNRMTVEEPSQVSLRVRITEVSRNVVKELGFNWDAILSNSGVVFGIATGHPVLDTSTTPPTFNTRTSGAGGTNNSIVLGYNSSTASADAIIDALETNGLVNILAEPNLTALSGETASFLAGGEFPIIIPSGSLGQTTVEFKQYGVSLAFTPVVLANGRISLRVKPEVSQLTSQGAVEISGVSIPALTTRRAETTIELGSGQSFAIGGLLQNTVNDAINKLPGLGDLPVLGPLFRSTSFQRSETELIILVTPYLVRPVDSQRMATPTDGTPTSPARVSDNPQAGLPTGGDLVGPAGFIVN